MQDCITPGGAITSDPKRLKATIRINLHTILNFKFDLTQFEKLVEAISHLDTLFLNHFIDRCGIFKNQGSKIIKKKGVNRRKVVPQLAWSLTGVTAPLCLQSI